jgi:AcrR family transcriptional regulator
MARLSCFSTDDFLKSAASLIADGGPETATTAAILRHAGASAGSFYYRFASRDQLLGELWLGLVEGYQRAFLDLLHAGDWRSAALFTPRWTRSHPIESRILLLYSKNDFVSEKWPATFVARANRNAEELKAGLQAFVERHWGECTEKTMRRAQFALIDMPLAAVRRHLAAHEQVPQWIDDMVQECCEVLISR